MIICQAPLQRLEYRAGANDSHIAHFRKDGDIKFVIMCSIFKSA